MNLIDSSIILPYFFCVVGLGFWYRKRAAQSLEPYFPGGKKLHWLLAGDNRLRRYSRCLALSSDFTQT
jgi:Na+/proline symporter